MKKTQQELLDAALSFLHLTRQAAGEDIAVIQSTLANWSQNDGWAATHSPVAFMAQAVEAEGRQRMHKWTKENECYHEVERSTCDICFQGDTE